MLSCACSTPTENGSSGPSSAGYSLSHLNGRRSDGEPLRLEVLVLVGSGPRVVHAGRARYSAVLHTRQAHADVGQQAGHGPRGSGITAASEDWTVKEWMRRVNSRKLKQARTSEREVMKSKRKRRRGETGTMAVWVVKGVSGWESSRSHSTSTSNNATWFSALADTFTGHTGSSRWR